MWQSDVTGKEVCRLPSSLPTKVRSSLKRVEEDKVGLSLSNSRNVMAGPLVPGLDPGIPTFVTPAEAGVQLAASQRMKLDSGLRRNDDEGCGGGAMRQIHQMHRAVRSGFAPSGDEGGVERPLAGRQL